MTGLENLWLDLPGVDPVRLEQNGVSFRASQMCGGVRQMRTDWVLACFTDPPSIYRYVPDPALIDLVAFDPAQPSRWRTKCGNAVMLGEAAFEEAAAYRLALPVHRTPLGWLQSGGAGVFPLDWKAFGRTMLGRGVELIGEDIEHARALRQLVEQAARAPLPKVRVAA